MYQDSNHNLLCVNDFLLDFNTDIENYFISNFLSELPLYQNYNCRFT